MNTGSNKVDLVVSDFTDSNGKPKPETADDEDNNQEDKVEKA